MNLSLSCLVTFWRRKKLERIEGDVMYVNPPLKNNIKKKVKLIVQTPLGRRH